VASETLGSRKSVIPKRTGRKRVVRVALFHPKRGLRWALSLSLSSPAIVIAMRRRCDAGKEGHVSFKEFSFPLDKYSLSGTVDLRAKRRNLLVWLLVVGGGSGCATSPPLLIHHVLCPGRGRAVPAGHRERERCGTRVLPETRVYEIGNSLLSRNALWTASPQRDNV